MTLLILKETFFHCVVAFLRMIFLLPEKMKKYGDQVYGLTFKSAFSVADTRLHPVILVQNIFEIVFFFSMF